MEIRNSVNSGKGQVGMERIPINELIDYKLFPQALRKQIISYSNCEAHFTYVGVIN